jgi:3-oxoacyl-[acyl-carrier protein] reductase
MTPPLDQRVALITGAHRGIGRAAALALGEAGASVIAVDLQDPSETAQAIVQRSGQAIAVTADVSDETSVKAVYDIIQARFRQLDVLVHCAGIIHERPLLETSTAEFDRVMAVNLRGTFLVGREAIRTMSLRGEGRVIVIASDLAYLGRAEFSPYVASKHGVLGLARSWALEFAPGILVNAICPGPIDTAMLDREHTSLEWRERELDIPLRRFGGPQEVADMAVFLAGPSAGFITGQGFGVNGGSVMA